MPIPQCFMDLFSDRMSTEDMADYLLRVIQPQLQIINGVASAVIDGPTYAMRLWLNPYAMAAHNVTPYDVNQAITTGELQAATGNVKNLWQQFSINAVTGLNTANQFNSLVIKNDKDKIVKLNDIGRAELGNKINDFAMSVDGKSGIFIEITPKSDANPLEMSDLVNKSMQQLQQYFPKGLHSMLLLDSSDYIKSSIAEIQKTLILAVIFVMLIVFLFLGSLRILFIPAVTIPLSIIGVFSVMLALGYSLNTLTFLALVLAVGMVVDDAIVVGENIYRHIALGKTNKDAALIGAREIQFAIISITLTLAAVYAPIGFASGLTKILFKEFAFTLAATVIISGILALTLTPMMCSKVMNANALETKFSKLTHKVSNEISCFYEKLLRKVLHVRYLVLIFLGIALTSCIVIYNILPQDLAPQEDEGFVWTEFHAPAAANFAYTKKYADKLNAIYSQIPEANHFGMFIGGWRAINEGRAFVN